MQKVINSKKILLVFSVIFGAYILLAVIIFLIAGDSFKVRRSRGNIDAPAATLGTLELGEGTSVEQRFTTKINNIEQLTLLFGTYYRPNSGTVFVDLTAADNGEILLHKEINAAAVTEGDTVVLKADEPVVNAYARPLVLRITSDSPFGEAVSPLMTQSESEGINEKYSENFSLYLNGEQTEGRLCFSISGTDPVWTGSHYFQITGAVGLVIAGYLAYSYVKFQKSRKTLLTRFIYALVKYKFLIKQLVNRDFKAKYKRSVLGVFWSFLNPLLTMLVQYIVFSNLFRFDIAYFPVYLLVGTIFFNFFTEATNMALNSIVGNAGLIKKVYVPKYIYPLTRILSSLINLLISLIPLFIVAFISGLTVKWSYLLLVYALFFFAVFCLGVGMLLAAAMVYFRDVSFLWGVMTMIWMYITPLFYPESVLEENLAWVLDVNPLFHYIKFARLCVIDGISPEPRAYVMCFVMAVISLIAGAFVFRKAQKNFVLYL